MIEVSILKEESFDSERFLGFLMKGHADSDVRGKDLVCCAASTLATDSINALTGVLGLKEGLSLDYRPGFMEVKVQKCEDAEKERMIQFALEVFSYNINQLKDQYPQYFHIEIKKGKTR